MVGFDAPCLGLGANRLDCCSNNSAHEDYILHCYRTKQIDVEYTRAEMVKNINNICN